MIFLLHKKKVIKVHDNCFGGCAHERERESILRCIRNKFEKKLSVRCDNCHLSHIMQNFRLQLQRMEGIKDVKYLLGHFRDKKFPQS